MVAETQARECREVRVNDMSLTFDGCLTHSPFVTQHVRSELLCSLVLAQSVPHVGCHIRTADKDAAAAVAESAEGSLQFRRENLVAVQLLAASQLSLLLLTEDKVHVIVFLQVDRTVLYGSHARRDERVTGSLYRTAVNERIVKRISGNRLVLIVGSRSAEACRIVIAPRNRTAELKHIADVADVIHIRNATVAHTVESGDIARHERIRSRQTGKSVDNHHLAL